MSGTVETVVRRMFRYWERQDPDAVASLFARDAIAESLSAGQTIRGREAIRQYLRETVATGMVVEVATHGFRRNARGQVVVTGRIRVRARGRGFTDIPATWAVQVNSRREISSITSTASTSGGRRSVNDRGAARRRRQALEARGRDRVLALSAGAAAAQRASAGLGTDDLEPTEWLFGTLLGTPPGAEGNS